jgi:hypothetical protein
MRQGAPQKSAHGDAPAAGADSARARATGKRSADDCMAAIESK